MTFKQYAYSKNRRSLPAETWEDFLQDCETVTKHLGAEGKLGTYPIMNNKHIVLKNLGEEESICLIIRREEESLFPEEIWLTPYCLEGSSSINITTSSKQDDLIISSILLLFKYHFKEQVDVSISKGSLAQGEGYTLLKRIFNYVLEY